MRQRPLLWGSLFTALLALAVRLVYYALTHQHVTDPDSGGYITLANRLADGIPLASHHAGPGFPIDLLRPPGYPMFLTIVNLGSHVSLSQTAVVQSCLGAIAIGAITYLAGRLFGLRAGVTTGTLLAIDWATVLYTPMVVADWLLSVLYTLSILLFAAFMIRKHSGWALASGLVLGAAILVKPAAEFGIAVLLITILIRPRAHWRGLVALIAVAIVMVPWAIRNDNDYHLVTVSPIGTINTYEFTALVALHGPLFWNPTEALQISNHFGGQLYKLHLSPAALDHRMQTEAFHIVIHRLPKTAVQALDGLARTAFGTGRDTLAIATGNRAIPSVVGTGLPLLQIVLYWLLAVVGTAVAWRNRIVPRPVLALLALATIVIILPAASPVANARFRVPAAPLLCVLAGYGLTVLLPAVRPAKVLSRA